MTRPDYLARTTRFDRTGRSRANFSRCPWKFVDQQSMRATDSHSRCAKSRRTVLRRASSSRTSYPRINPPEIASEKLDSRSRHSALLARPPARPPVTEITRHRCPGIDRALNNSTRHRSRRLFLASPSHRDLQPAARPARPATFNGTARTRLFRASSFGILAPSARRRFAASIRHAACPRHQRYLALYQLFLSPYFMYPKLPIRIYRFITLLLSLYINRIAVDRISLSSVF